MNSPIFSIITPTYKRPHLLKRAIGSVLNQSLDNFEQIVVDDANETTAAELVAGYKDPRLRYVAHETSRGAAGAYNTGIKLARGRFINFLDDDDEYLPGILEKTNRLFEESQGRIGFVWTGITRVKDTENGEEVIRTKAWPSEFISKEEGLMVSTAIGNGFGLSVRKECIETVGAYDETLRVGEDTDFVIRLSKQYDFRTVPEVLVKIHHHGDTQLTHANNDEARWKCYQEIIRQHSAFLSKYWQVFNMHSQVYIKLCYALNKKSAGRKAFWNLFRTCPFHKATYFDWICYELFGFDYERYNSRKKQETVT